MRHSKLALVLIRLNINAQPHIVLARHKGWADWSLIGGHVEPDEKNDWARAAERECNEELAPLEFGKDFFLLPLLTQPVSWGPVLSKSADNEPTIYTAQFFALRFLKAPMECLKRLPPGEFRIVSEAELESSEIKAVSTLATAQRALGGLHRAVLAWDAVLPSPLAGESRVGALA